MWRCLLRQLSPMDSHYLATCLFSHSIGASLVMIHCKLKEVSKTVGIKLLIWEPACIMSIWLNLVAMSLVCYPIFHTFLSSNHLIFFLWKSSVKELENKIFHNCPLKSSWAKWDNRLGQSIVQYSKLESTNKNNQNSNKNQMKSQLFSITKCIAFQTQTLGIKVFRA